MKSLHLIHDSDTYKKNYMLAYLHSLHFQHLMKKYPIMQLIRKALFIFIISELKTYKRNCGTHNVHRLIYKTNAKTVQYLHVKNK